MERYSGITVKAAESPDVAPQEDVIKTDVPLFIRLLEFAREDASGDLDLHDVAKAAIGFGDKVLTMDNYEALVPKQPPEKKAPKTADKETDKPAPTKADVIGFISENPNPTDDAFHDWAEGKGFDVSKAESVAYSIISDAIARAKK